MSNLPSYLEAAKPVPLANRAPWYKTIAPTYTASCSGTYSGATYAMAGKSTPFPAACWRRLPLPLPRFGHRRRDLPFSVLSRAGPAGHENRLAALRGRHFDLWRTGQLYHARFPHGPVAVRLAGRQCQRRGRRALPLFPTRVSRLGHRLEPRNHRRGVRGPGGLYRSERHQVHGPRGHLPSADPGGRLARDAGRHLPRTESLRHRQARSHRPHGQRNLGQLARRGDCFAFTWSGSLPRRGRQASISPPTAAASKTFTSAESWASCCLPSWPAL